ncbi:586_t:CDS:2, partial [Gigaspora rosea]
ANENRLSQRISGMIDITRQASNTKGNKKKNLTIYADQETDVNKIACTEVDYFDIGHVIQELTDNTKVMELLIQKVPELLPKDLLAPGINEMEEKKRTKAKEAKDDRNG